MSLVVQIEYVSPIATAAMATVRYGNSADDMHSLGRLMGLAVQALPGNVTGDPSHLLAGLQHEWPALGQQVPAAVDEYGGTAEEQLTALRLDMQTLVAAVRAMLADPDSIRRRHDVDVLLCRADGEDDTSLGEQKPD